MKEIQTIKQGKGTGMCAVCAVAMAAECSVEDVYSWLNDERVYGDPITDTEAAMFLLSRGILMGWAGQVHSEDDRTQDKPVSEVQLNWTTEGRPAYLGVVSRNYPGLGHAVYWDGQFVRDPDPGVPDRTRLDDYIILQVWPLLSSAIGSESKRIRCHPSALPFFVKRWRASKVVINDEVDG